MDVKAFFSIAAQGARQFREGLDKNSIATGFAGGVVVMLGLSALLPDTTRQFVDDVRGHKREGKRHTDHARKDPDGNTPDFKERVRDERPDGRGAKAL